MFMVFIKKVSYFVKHTFNIFIGNDTRLSEIIIFLYSFWWAFCLAFLQSEESYINWVGYWRMERIFPVFIWRAVPSILFLLPMISLFTGSIKIRRIWLFMSLIWWTFVGTVFLLARYMNPNTIAPSIIAFISLITYLDISIQTTLKDILNKNTND